MRKWIHIENLDSVKDNLASLVTQKLRLRGLRHCDVRLGLDEGFTIVAQDEKLKSYQKDFSLSYGIRVIAGPTNSSANGFLGGYIGAPDFSKIIKIISQGIEVAYERAVANAKRKLKTKEKFPHLGYILQNEVILAKIPVIRDTIRGEYKIDPRTVRKDEAEKYILETEALVRKRYREIKTSLTDAFSFLERQIFVSSEGSVIDQTYAFTGASVFYTAQYDNLPPADLYHHTGNQLGWEALEDGRNVYEKDLSQFALRIAQETVTLAKAKPCPTSNKPVTVVTDPDFNGLVAHEIVGHPAELDRALKWETGYAGRSRFLKTLHENQVGSEIASRLVSAFSDPTVRGGYGYYIYDDEGTPAQRVYHIKHGIFREFMTSRETAAIWGSVPNGHYKANSASAIPLIRMSVSAFEAGLSDPARIIKEVDHGYYVVGHRIPSISESREHFRISPRLIYEIRNGKIGQVFRDGSISSNSEAYLKSIDAVGNDFKIFPIPNCGKGQPMQSKMVGNGGPTMRGKAYLVGK